MPDKPVKIEDLDANPVSKRLEALLSAKDETAGQIKTLSHLVATLLDEIMKLRRISDPVTKNQRRLFIFSGAFLGGAGVEMCIHFFTTIFRGR